jgi:hypothetical protein
MNLNPNFGDEFLNLPTQFLFSLYNLIVTSGVVHFGVFCFYKYKEIDKNNVIASHYKVEL